MSETKQIVEAKGDYQATATQELSIRKGEKLILLDDTKLFWQVENTNGDVGNVPSHFVKEVKPSFGSRIMNIMKPKKKKVPVLFLFGENRQSTSYDQRARTPTSDTADADDTLELPYAVVVKHFIARHENELSLRIGDIVIVQEQNSEWWLGECNGLSGWFRPNCVIELTECASGNTEYYGSLRGIQSDVVDDLIFRAVAVFQWTGSDDEDLDFEQDEQLDIVGVFNSQWWVARNKNGEIGTVPNSHLEILYDDATSIVGKVTQTSAMEESSAEASGHQTIVSEPEQKVQVKGENQAKGVQELPPSDISDDDGTFKMPITTGLIAVVAKHHYTARQEDELSLRKGDQVNVQEKSSDGWWRGECNGLSGWFPSNYCTVTEDGDNVIRGHKSRVSSGGESSAAADDFIHGVIALYSYTRRDDDELTFAEDEQLDIVEHPEHQPWWWWARNKDGEIGMVSTKYVQVLENASPIFGQRTQSSAQSNATGGLGAGTSGHQADHSADERSDSILEYHEYLGGGASGEVHRVIWMNKNHQATEAAAKRVRITEDHGTEDILREAEMLKKLNHVNVIKFFGLETTESHVIIVTEYASKGSLRGILKRSKRLSKRLFDRWMLEAALGIQYAHHQGIVHCDVKSENFVVSGEDMLKLCDLGIARHLTKTTKTSNEKGTEFWQAPEVFKQQLRSPACDVYSYGVVVWELYTCDYPGRGFTVPGAYQYRVGTEKYRPPIPDDCLDSVRNLIERCWYEEYKQRPHMDKVVRYIQEGHSSVEELC